LIAVEGVVIQLLNSENTGCTKANQGCGEQHPAHHLKPLCEWSPHGLSVEWVVPKWWFIKFFQQRVGFQLKNKLIELGYTIQSVTLDGKRGLYKAFKDILIQMYHFHQKKDCTTIYYNET
jgi:hypothetical protein